MVACAPGNIVRARVGRKFTQLDDPVRVAPRKTRSYRNEVRDTVLVYRAYNNGFTGGIDSNHRITANQQVYQTQIAKGRNGEGVVMCALQ
jgi:hypothetical protein